MRWTFRRCAGRSEMTGRGFQTTLCVAPDSQDFPRGPKTWKMMTGGWRRAWPIGCAALLYAATPMAGQAPLEGLAGLRVENESIEVVLRLLQRTAGVSLVYSPDLLPAQARVSCACENVTVRDALDRIFADTELAYSASRTQIRITSRRRRREAAARGVILGRVVDAATEAPIANAMIRLDSGRGVLSDAAGHFMIRDVPPGAYRMEVTSIGWQPGGLDVVEVTEADTVSVIARLGRAVIPLAGLLVAPGTFSMLEDASPGAVRALTREEIETMPQVGEDVFRAVKRLPGVASDDISTKLSVRGGSDREVLVRLDGIELYEPYHLKDWEGALGIVDLHAVGGVELEAGGFGAEHGDKMAGVLDMTSRTWVGDSKTTLGFSVSNVTASGRGSFDDETGSWLLSARRGFMDWVLALTGGDDSLSPQYYDVFGKVSHELGRRHLVSFHVLHAGDKLVLAGTPPEGLDAIDFRSRWQSSYAWANWDASLGRASATTSVWTGRLKRERRGFLEDLNDAPNMISVEDDRGFAFGGLRHDLDLELAEWAMLKVGGEVKRVRADYAYSNVTRHNVRLPNDDVVQGFDSMRVDLEPEGHELSGFLATRIRPVPRLTAELGVRYDQVSHTGDDDVAPRLLAAFDASDHTTLRASWGRYYQSHGIQELEVGDGETRFHPSERADQAALGVEHGFPGGVRLRVELYRRAVEDPKPMFFNLGQQIEIFPEATGDRVRLDPTRGRARGLELMVDRRTGRRLAWSASYVLAWAEDEIDGVWVPRRYDQRHTVGAHATYRPDDRWHLSAGWRYHTGWATTSWTWDVTPLKSGWNWWDRRFGPVRGVRLPAYHRLDLRATRDFVVGGNRLHAFVDLFNVYNRTNLGSYGYSGTFTNNRLFVDRENGQEMLPLLPTFGFRYEF